MRLWENKCDLMGKRMDFKAYGKLNVILWEEFPYGKINVILWEKNVMRKKMGNFIPFLFVYFARSVYCQFFLSFLLMAIGGKKLNFNDIKN